MAGPVSRSISHVWFLCELPSSHRRGQRDVDGLHWKVSSLGRQRWAWEGPGGFFFQLLFHALPGPLCPSKISPSDVIIPLSSVTFPLRISIHQMADSVLQSDTVKPILIAVISQGGRWMDITTNVTFRCGIDLIHSSLTSQSYASSQSCINAVDD